MSNREKPSSSNSQEQRGPSPKEALFVLRSKSKEVINTTTEAARAIEESSLDPEAKIRLRTRLARTLKKMLTTFSFGAVLISGIETGMHVASKYKVNSITKPDRSIEYVHDDAETTHNLNILAGKEQFTDADRRKLAQDDEFTPNPNLGGSFDPELYAAIWKLEQEAGNPKIRFVYYEENSPLTPAHIHEKRSYYIPLTHTAYVEIGRNDQTIERFISELSHGKQYSDNFIFSKMMELGDKVTVIAKSLENLTSLEKTYDDVLYDRPESTEFEAHKIIEPQLVREFETLTPNVVAKQKERHDAYEAEINKIDREFNLAREKAFKTSRQGVDASNLAERRKADAEYHKRAAELEKIMGAKELAARKKFGIK